MMPHVAALFVLLAPAIQADQFAEGNRLYQQGDFDAALASYVEIAEQGYENATLFYNIGNTHFKLGNLGSAILYYERTLRLSPGDDDAQANLALARSLTVDDVTPAPQFWLFRVVSWWVHLIPRQVLVVVVAFAWCTVAAGVALRILARGPAAARWGLRTAVVAAICVLLLGTNLVVLEAGIGRPDEAIVMAGEVPVQSAPSGDPSLQIFAIHEGTKVQVHRRAEGWSEIVLEDGKVGWIRERAIERI